MSNSADPEKEKFWSQHVAEFKKFNGRLAEYCKVHNLSIDNFKYWNRKLSTFGKPKSSAPICPNACAFATVSVAASGPCVPETRGLPDPQWVAAIIFDLHRRFA